MKAYILVVVSPGTERQIKQELEKLEQVKRVAIVYGAYDLVLEVEVKDIAELHDLVLDTIRQRKEVESTITLVVAED